MLRPEILEIHRPRQKRFSHFCFLPHEPRDFTLSVPDKRGTREGLFEYVCLSHQNGEVGQGNRNRGPGTSAHFETFLSFAALFSIGHR